jgi:hypothetical protein
MQVTSPQRLRAWRLAAAALAAGLVLVVAPVPQVSFTPVAAASVAQPPAWKAAERSSITDQRAVADAPIGAARVSALESATEPFAMLGVSLDTMPEEPVMVRVRDVSGDWSEWNQLEVDRDTAPDPRTPEAQQAVVAGGVVTEPLWTGNSTGYELSLGRGDSVGVEVALVRERTRRVLTDAVPLADATVAAPFSIRSRADWSARASRSTPTIASSGLRLAVVHHTAASNDYSQSDVPAIIRSMQAYHMDANGWSDLGYNFVVDKFGGVWEGRAGGINNAVVGAHAAGFNTGSVGVAVMGNYVNVSSTTAARESVASVIGYRLHQYGVSPTGRVQLTSGGSSTIPAGTVVDLPRVVGHRDVGATACPGSLYGNLGTIRDRAGSWYSTMDSLTSPSGAVSAVRVDRSRVDVIGWAIDPDVEVPARVHVVLAGRLVEVLANGLRPDVGRLYPGHGDYRGWNAGFSNVPPGTHRLCVTGINQGLGKDRLINCRDVVVK